MLYKDYIEKLKNEWIGEKVIYEEREYRVLDVDYNAALLIDKPARFTDTTAVDICMVFKAEDEPFRWW